MVTRDQLQNMNDMLSICRMQHPLADVMEAADRFLLIGDSSQERFPALSYNAYVKTNKRFYCLDMGGLTVSRGPTRGGKVFSAVSELPAGEVGELAILWVKPKRAREAVELAHQAGCSKVWFSFHTAHPTAIARAEELGMQVIEVGRCPVYYLKGAPPACRAHTAVVRLSGTRGRAPQQVLDTSQRIMW